MIDNVINEFPVALGFYNARPAQDGKMLRGHRLFEAKMYVDFGDCQLFVLIQEADDLLTEFVIEGS